MYRHAYIISDIEGSSGCWSYKASSFLTKEWSYACKEMSKDVDTVVKGLFDAGVKSVTIKDFHRTGYNLFPELIDKRADIISGYIKGPVPGLGDPGSSKALLFLGMHAASGTGGFLPHTLTSRVDRLELNGKILPEIELFASSLSDFGLKPVFFSGCPVACLQAKQSINDITTYPIDKELKQNKFHKETWRSGLATSAVKSMSNSKVQPFKFKKKKFNCIITMRDGKKEALKIARRWGFSQKGRTVFFNTYDFNELYLNLIRICYLTPFIEYILPIGLPLFNFRGRAGLIWARRQLSINHEKKI